MAQAEAVAPKERGSTPMPWKPERYAELRPASARNNRQPRRSRFCPAPRPQGSTAARAASIPGISPWTRQKLHSPNIGDQPDGILVAMMLVPRNERGDQPEFEDEPAPAERPATNAGINPDRRAANPGNHPVTPAPAGINLRPGARRIRSAPPPRTQENNITRPPWPTAVHAAPSPRINEHPEIQGINLPHTPMNAGIAALPRKRREQPCAPLA